jgi:hypothetical protein
MRYKERTSIQWSQATPGRIIAKEATKQSYLSFTIFRIMLQKLRTRTRPEHHRLILVRTASLLIFDFDTFARQGIIDHSSEGDIHIYTVGDNTCRPSSSLIRPQ